MKPPDTASIVFRRPPQVGQLGLRNDGAARPQCVQPFIASVGLGPLGPASCSGSSSAPVARIPSAALVRMAQCALFDRLGPQPGDERLRQRSAVDLGERFVEAPGRLTCDPEDGQSTMRRQHLGGLAAPATGSTQCQLSPATTTSNLRPAASQASKVEISTSTPLRCANSAIRGSGSTPSTVQPAAETAARRCLCRRPHRARVDQGRQRRFGRSGSRDSVVARGHNVQGPTRTIPPADDGRARCRERRQPRVEGTRSLWHGGRSSREDAHMHREPRGRGVVLRSRHPRSPPTPPLAR